MFERYITDALTTHFGHILETVDADKMQLSAWRGELELHDVTLRKDALDNILKKECPVEIAFGEIGTFHVKIPWKLLSAQFLSWQSSQQQSSSSQQTDGTGSGNAVSTEEQQPNNHLLESSVCSIVLSDVNILVTPRRKADNADDDNETENNQETKSDDDDDTEDSELRQRADKEKEVQSLLDANLLKRVAESSSVSVSSAARWVWLQDWISSLLSTLSVTVKNIHIRYEDPGTSMGFQWNSHISENTNGRINNNSISIRDNSFFFSKRQQQYRPAFAVGITLKEFSIQSSSASAVKSAREGVSGGSIAAIDGAIPGQTEEQLIIAGTVRTDDDTTTLSSSGAATISKDNTSLSNNNKPLIGETPSSSATQSQFINRYKLAAAEHLAVYWDSDSPLVCLRAALSNDGGHNNNNADHPRQRAILLYQESFALLNDGKDSQMPLETSTAGLFHHHHHRSKHAYLLDPISPSVHLTLVSKSTDSTVEQPSEDTGKGRGQTGNDPAATRRSIVLQPKKSDTPAPPSSIQVNLPPCKFTLAKNTLEDSVYLRKSLSVWMDAERTLLSEETLRRLAKLRPVESAQADPSSWWLYAFEATKALIRVDQESRDGRVRNKTYYSHSKNADGTTAPLTRRKGWYGLVQAVSRRRKYVGLYQSLLQASEAGHREPEGKAHRALLSMEDELFPDEIVSFRIHAYETLATKAKSVVSADEASDGVPTHENDPEQDPTLIKGETDAEILSVQHRKWMMNEMKQALDRERANRESKHVDDEYRASIRNLSMDASHMNKEQNVLMWTSSLVCRELAIQVNDQGSDHGSSGKHKHFIPIVRLSTAILQDQSWYQDGSWVANYSFASLEVKDLISSKDREFASKHFQTLLGRKTGHSSNGSEEFIVINGIRYHKSISVTVNKKLHWTGKLAPIDPGKGRGSTTTTLVRILPMEVVYSTIPVEGVSRVFSSVRTPEIVDDYHKVLAAASSWREEQKRKLMDALAHKNKKIIVDIDVNAPEILIPEDLHRLDSPMLAIDLGRIQAYNDDDALNGDTVDDFDDQLRLVVSNVQARTTTVESYFSSAKSRRGLSNDHQASSPQQLIEAFSIDFVVSTKFTESDSGTSEDASKIHVSGTLPRLAFNFTSSAIFLVNRLQQRWMRRKRELEIQNLISQPLDQAYISTPSAAHPKQMLAKRKSDRKSSKTQDSQNTSRTFRFDFSAPFITLKLENDVRTDSSKLGLVTTTPLFDMAIGGISGSFLQTVAYNSDSSTKFNASLQSLGIIDLFQSAGSDFVLLLSSVPQVTLIDKIKVGPTYSWDAVHGDSAMRQNLRERKALVTFEYLNETESTVDEDGLRIPVISPKEVSIWFHELYVEWNPETLAAVQNAVRTPSETSESKDLQKHPSRISSDEENSYSSSSEDEFYDAVENFRGEESSSSSAHSLSEISTTTDNSTSLQPWSLPLPNSGSFIGDGIPSPSRLSFASAPGSPLFASGLSQFESATMLPIPTEVKKDDVSQPMKLVFELSKLRVSFNKETRHRKLVVAQMDRTYISYVTKSAGGSNIRARIGNLIFVDPAHERKETLYGYILGLKSDANDDSEDTPSSLLEMQIVLNPKSRVYSSVLDGEKTDSVTIDRNKGAMCGSDCSLTATLSPMRFVVVEQLWLEIIDYLFQGVIGSEVLGSSKVESQAGTNRSGIIKSRYHDPAFLPGSEATGMSFTLFDVTLESPVILLPVTYASPEFIRLELANIAVSNKYEGTVLSDAPVATDEEGPPKRMQWFNNCRITLDNLRLFSWSGLELGREAVIGTVRIRWPTGPQAERVTPKWRVECNLDSLDIALRRSDYALLQNIISYNIGEQSRYMDEWAALQNLSSHAFKSYMQKIVVHYGYDKKDVAPSTYHMSISVPSLKFNLMGGERTAVSSPVAIARCFDLMFDMEKGSNLIVKQKVTCDIDVVTLSDSDTKFEKLLSMSKYDNDFDGIDLVGDDEKTGLTYTSRSLPTKDAVKTLEIRDACIYMIVQKWRNFTSFFQSLAPPIVLNEHDIGSSIQVGDRWYRIGESGPSPMPAPDSSQLDTPTSSRRFTWLNVGSTANFYPPQARNSSGLSTSPQSDSPTSQWRILLTWPRIVLSSSSIDGPPLRVVLRMHHLDYLQTNKASTCSLEKSLFLHDVEVYTSKGRSASNSPRDQGQNSLIHPWSVALSVSTCNGERLGDCEKHSYVATSTVLRARAAYSDMATTMDVVLSVLHSTREEASDIPEDMPLEPIFTAGSYDSHDVSTVNSVAKGSFDDDEMFCSTPIKVVYDIQCDGFQLQVADDSGRHFAGSQDLVMLSLGMLLFSRTEWNGTTEMKLWLKDLDIIDCLQPTNSRFRMAAASAARTSDNSEDTVSQEMAWDLFVSRMSESILYGQSEAFAARTDAASAECYLHFWNSGAKSSVPGLIEMECRITRQTNQGKMTADTTKTCNEIDVRIRSFAVQWNPSTVIAVQRFLGRLRKESKAIAIQFDDILGSQKNEVEGTQEESSENETEGTQNSVLSMKLQIDKLTVYLNKEHQYRRLLELVFTKCNVQLQSSNGGTMIECSLDDLAVVDRDRYTFGTGGEKLITDDMRNVLCVLKMDGGRESDHFLHVVYKKFTKQATSVDRGEVPNWVLSHSASADDIDDILSVNLASTRFTYLKERTDEMLDYLSNGLPGKGMGATSRAAKGFISRRIQTKSFLQLQVSSSQFYIPQHEMETRGLSLRLGDVSVRSWFEEQPVEARLDETEWWRVLSLKVTGFQSGVTRAGASSEALSSTTNPVDLDVLLRKATVQGRTLFVKGNLSCFAVSLNYTDYALLRAVVRDNIGRAVDTEKWDNVEKAYWMESVETKREGTNDDIPADGVAEHNKVLYSSNARFVRYGKRGKKGKNAGPKGEVSTHLDGEQSSQNTLDLRFDMDGLAMKLRRDDVVHGIMPDDDLASSFYYDVMLLRVDMVEIMTTSSAAGDISFNLSLFRLGLFDLGDSGRLIRERYYLSLPDNQSSSYPKYNRKIPRKPCPFQVLVEGYDASAENGNPDGVDMSHDDETDDDKGPQFVVSVDTCPASSTAGFGSLSESGLPPDAKVTVARIIINHLSVNALVRPFQEIVAFLTCRWRTGMEEPTEYVRPSDKPSKVRPTEDGAVVTTGKGFELKLVSHYPRVFFLADESDPHSRALVLRGLAVINVSNVTRVEAVGTRNSDSVDSQHITAVDAQLHGLETYINPDVDSALRFRHRHAEMIGDWVDIEMPQEFATGPLDNGDTLGVALIQPVTTGIEFTQTVRDLFPMRRSLLINIEPVSTMLSFEDLQLVEVVLNRWSTKGEKATVSSKDERQEAEATNASSIEQYEIKFEDARLGLGLKMEDGEIVISSVQNDKHASAIQPGDALMAVGEDQVARKSLEQVVKMLARAQRPISIRFGRKMLNGQLPACDQEDSLSSDAGRSATPLPSEAKDHELVGKSFQCPIYSLTFYLGTPLGLELEESPCGKFPVVSKVLPTIDEAVVVQNAFDATNDEQIEIFEPAFDPSTTRIPKVGAVVVAIDGIPIEEIGVEDAWELLSRTQTATDSPRQAPNDFAASGATFRLAFQEIDSAVWGKVETADISIAGVALSFIDDLNGRDMPLFRGKLNTLEFHAARGIGVESNIIDMTVPLLLSPLDMENLDDSTVTLSPGTVQEIRKESVVSLTAIGKFSVDYFHPRVAYWEPLLEPSQLFFLLEKQEGSIESQRPAQMALEMSDRLPGSHSVRTNLAQSIYFRESSMVSVNITDAAAEVLVQGLQRWKMWRQDVSSGMLDSGEAYESSEVLPPTVFETTASSRPNEPDRAAAQRAAQAALVFAQKRGAETTKNSPSSKPFIFRNRTGMSIAFVQQGKGMRDNGYSRRRAFESRGSSGGSETAIGEYRGLERYKQRAITELADQEEAKLDIDLIEDESKNGSIMGRSVRHFNNKVRSYEGRYPDLSVAIQAVAGVTIEPLTDLQVFKVGSTIRYLIVKKETYAAGTEIHSIRVVWNVELEDNRRILTLSTAVRLVSSGLGIPAEVGVRRGTSRSESRSDASITSIGFASSNAPLYMPLWLALKLEPISICIRPASTTSSDYEWSEDAVLQFGPKDKVDSRTDASSFGRWTWEETFQELSFVRCHSQSFEKNSVWFSVFGSSPFAGDGKSTAQLPEQKKESRRRDESDLSDVLSITLDSSLTLRNMLPVDIDLEVLCSPKSERDTASKAMPSIEVTPSGLTATEFSKIESLDSGECTEVMEYCHNVSNLRARLKKTRGSNWSSWATLQLDDTSDADDEYEVSDPSEAVAALLPSSCQVNVEISDRSLGVPLVFGVRILPKMTTDDPFRGHVYGLEIIIYAEIWIRNITNLPLNFGCPAYQLHNAAPDQQTSESSFDESVAKFTAESALMEIANLLEVGDKGTGLNQAVARKIAESGTIESLPDQDTKELVEEVFEYIEISGSLVRRRWWASESFDSYRQNITNAQDDAAAWKWIDDKWAIDSSGDAKPSVDGWESCRNLLAGNSSFTGSRSFDSSDGFRRRRYFRCRNGMQKNDGMKHELSAEIQAFHHPLNDSFTRNQKKLRQRGKKSRSIDLKRDEKDGDNQTKLSVKCGDGRWSTPLVVPDNGTAYGVIKVMASRWPKLTMNKKNDSSRNLVVKKSGPSTKDASKGFVFKSACLESNMHELCYIISDVSGEWGEFSRTIEVSPRFVIRNDSTMYHLLIKQTGAPDSTGLELKPGHASPFYWADFQLPKLVSVKPIDSLNGSRTTHKWSGGFDLSSLGMTPVRVRCSTSAASDVISVRSLVEVRSGTGGMGMNVSLREESPNESLFRIENLTTFPIWLEQDGMLANPTSKGQQASGTTWEDELPSIDGDCVGPNSKMTFSLDIPYRQGKYSSRTEATLSELLHIRVALAPLSSRPGVEMVKVIGLTTVGETVRLNPSKLPLDLTQEGWQQIRLMRVLGVVASDGPTRVLRFCLMAYAPNDLSLTSSFGESPYSTTFASKRPVDRVLASDQQDFSAAITRAAYDAIDVSKTESIPNELDAKRKALFTNFSAGVNESIGGVLDTIFSVRAEFTGFIFSLIDAAPSEIAVASCRNVNVLTRWNALRTTDASVLVSIGWLQVDNHVPSAPFKVAVRPDTSANISKDPAYLNEGNTSAAASPLLVVALAFAPKHKSKIMVLRSATVAPRDLVIAVDLAFLVRLQRFFYGLQEHLSKKPASDSLQGTRTGLGAVHVDEKRQIPFPDFESAEKQLEQIAAFSENRKLYFQGLTILPTNIKLSVAPARALTPEQAGLEGKETAAIHQAVRKGDVLVGSNSGPLGVRVGKKNKTPLAVVRGVFKSIVVDAILRMDGASLNFPGVSLRNHIATGSQLTTLLSAHYLSSLKSNVPALLGSLSAIGNPLGLIRGIGDGVVDFVNEPVKGLKRSLKELDPGYAVDGVARGTESLARHTVGGLADSASLLLETFSKYMAVVTLDRRYAQKRDTRRSLRNRSESRVTLAGGVESGFSKLIQGFREGVTGVVRAPIRGAEKRGFEGFAKGLGKGLLGLLVKPIVGITDAATDVMIGVKSTVEYKEEQQQSLALLKNQLRPRRPMYGRDKVLRPYRLEDAAAATLMLRTRCAGENYLSHMDMNDRVALLSVKRLVVLGSRGEEQLALKYKHIKRLEARPIAHEDGTDGWAIVVILNTPRRNGSEVEVISCHSEQEALDLCSQIQRGVDLESSDAMVPT